MTTEFARDIQSFNAMYKLPFSLIPTLEVVPLVNGEPTTATPEQQAVGRLANFKKILLEELDEIDLIIQKLNTRISVMDSEGDAEEPESQVAILTEVADLLGDIQVYCASEMGKFGIPLNQTLEIIMQSNFSKLGEDGKPIYDERGKVQKGPGYWKPEPKLETMLTALMPKPTLDAEDKAEWESDPEDEVAK